MGTHRDPTDTTQPPATTAERPLAHREQTRNIVLFALNVGLIYLAAPVTYVSLVHGGLLNRLGFSDTIANLPAGVYLWTTPLPVLVAWCFPQVRLLKPLLVASFLSIAVMGAVVATTVLLLGPELVLAALLAHAAVLGCALGVVAVCQWEVIGRGVAEARRGQALGLAYGAGPMLAVLASFASQLVLGGKVEVPGMTLRAGPVEFPWSFASLFLASLPIMALAALFSSWFVVRLPSAESAREPFLAGMAQGARQFFGSRLILISAIAYVLVYGCNMIQQNVSLYAPLVLGGQVQDRVGAQLMLRFGFKIVAGFCLGWLLVRTNPRALLVTTAALTLAGVAWAMVAPTDWLMLSFGVLGAGELFGVYYPNYVLGCSPRAHLRRNMAFASLVTMPVGLAGVLFGKISDGLGQSDKAFGYQASFVAAMLLATIAIVLVMMGLPAQPRPERASEAPQE